jgi:curved DNA-binding protein
LDSTVAYKDYYQILEISRSASEDEVKQAYRKLARKYHPDVSKEPNAEQRFKDLNEAHDVLKDAKKRALYDQYGESWRAVAEGRAAPGAEHARDDFRAQGFDFDPSEFQGQDFGSIFEQFFGGGRFRGRAGGRGARDEGAWPDMGSDREATIELSVDEAYRGGERSISLLDGATGEQRSYNVRIPPGVRSGQRIRLAGQGERGGSGAGDLYLRVQLRPSDQYRLDGDDIHLSLRVTPWEAALGASVDVPTLDGNVRVKVPAGSSSGRKIRLKGKGYPGAQKERGDLYAEIRVEVPTSVSPEERELLEKWASISSFNPRTEVRS